MARDEIYFNRTVAIKEIVEGIDKVTARDIARLAREIFNPDKVTLAAIGKVKDRDIPKALKQ